MDNPHKQFNDSLKRVGTAFDEAAGISRRIIPILDDMSAAIERLNLAQRQAQDRLNIWMCKVLFVILCVAAYYLLEITF